MTIAHAIDTFLTHFQGKYFCEKRHTDFFFLRAVPVSDLATHMQVGGTDDAAKHQYLYYN